MYKSSIEDIFELLQKDLDNGVEVLFSGTPCQIAAIKTFIRKNTQIFSCRNNLSWSSE